MERRRVFRFPLSNLLHSPTAQYVRFGFMRFYLVAPLVVMITTFWSIMTVVSRPFDRQARFYHWILRTWSRTLLALFGIRVAITGTEHLDRSQSYVYLANHASYLDIIVVGATLPDEIRFVLKRELGRIPIFGWGLALGPYILIDRADARNAMASIEKGAADIRNGASVIIFPEGTRTSDGNLAPFKRGGFMLAIRSGVPMAPVAIRGTYRLMSRHDRTVKSGKVTVTIGHPIQGNSDATRAEAAAIQEQVRAQLMEMLRDEL